ncbi:U32 family peptidase [Candidatus Pacearchaeota archaeon]|nr:U32 family peptidase [Candidatus Pacearchaeota archaeon]
MAKGHKKKFELLAPAGDFPMLVSAVNAGADAVYFGLQDFNMRDTAKNFKISDLKKIEQLCKSKKVKRYLTLNTIIYSNELAKIEQIIRQVKNKVDAIICWDLAIVQLCKKYKIPFHISTQASVSNLEAAKFYKRLGAERIVLAREVNLKQIKEISKILPIECFCHGAMCVSISGRCFTSQFLFNKSANRGRCLQPCRRSYFVKDENGRELRVQNNKIFSAKDLCTLPFLDKLKGSGITAFKIEGRNRDARYVDVVVRVYRQALDKKLTQKELAKSLKQLSKIYNKGFSSGFYLRPPTNDDFSKIEHSSATEKKAFVGKILHYYPKIKVATLKIIDNSIKLGDKIVIIGKTTGIVYANINRIEMHKKPVKTAKQGNEIGVRITSLVRKNDEVYLIKRVKK